MYRTINNKCYFAEANNDIRLSDPFIGKYYEFLRMSLAISSAKKHISAIHKFWIYNIYFSKIEDENFEDYAYRYRDTIMDSGYKVDINFNGLKPAVIYDFHSVKNPRFDMEALEKYYIYLLDRDLNPKEFLMIDFPIYLYLDSFDTKALEAKEKHSKGKGYGLKARGLMRDNLLKRKTIFTKLKKSRKSSRESAKPKSIMTFPLQAFNELLENTKNPRSKLLYLICGACSARIGQALTLTIYDIDIENQEVYLTDPLSNNVPYDINGQILKNQPPRRELLKRFNIDFEMKPYNLIGFKYPIPSLDTNDRTLHFLLPVYRKMFFDTYIEWYDSMDKNFPMVFQTESHINTSILLSSSATTLLKGDLKKLDKKFPQFKLLNLKNAFHSFRHMFGRCMADFAYMNYSMDKANQNIILPNEESENSIEIWIDYTRKKMGHGNSETTRKRYFHTGRAVENYVTEQIINNQSEFLRIKASVFEAIG